MSLDEDALTVGLLGELEGEALVGQVIFLRRLGEEGFVPLLEAQVGQLVGT